MSSGVRGAVEVLYQVFGRYPLPGDAGYCHHCIDPQDVATLHATPLRRIGPDMAGRLLVKHSTWGDEAYHNHFLPRVLELIATGRMNTWWWETCLPSVLSPLWRHGSDEEQRVIGDFAAAWWQETTSTWPSPCDAESVLETIANCEQDIRPFLDAWPVTAGEPAAWQLATLVRDLLMSSRSDVPFRPHVEAWLYGPFPADALLDWLVNTRDPDLAEQLGAVADHLELCRKARGED